MLKECKTKECQNKFQRLDWKEYENEDYHVREGEVRYNRALISWGKNKHALAKDNREWRKMVLGVMGEKGLWRLRRRRRRRRRRTRTRTRTRTRVGNKKMLLRIYLKWSIREQYKLDE